VRIEIVRRYELSEKSKGFIRALMGEVMTAYETKVQEVIQAAQVALAYQKQQLADKDATLAAKDQELSVAREQAPTPEGYALVEQALSEFRGVIPPAPSPQ
jgi:hypothetical protein